MRHRKAGTYPNLDECPFAENVMTIPQICELFAGLEPSVDWSAGAETMRCLAKGEIVPGAFQIKRRWYMKPKDLLESLKQYDAEVFEKRSAARKKYIANRKKLDAVKEVASERGNLTEQRITTLERKVLTQEKQIDRLYEMIRELKAVEV